MASKAICRQCDGHPEVVVKDAPASSGNIIAKLPNETAVEILSEHGDYWKIRSGAIEGFARSSNLLRETVKVTYACPTCAKPHSTVHDAMQCCSGSAPQAAEGGPAWKYSCPKCGKGEFPSAQYALACCKSADASGIMAAL
mmetsp:Transcript_115750/g.216679  ORF Transcript_115750/g.216679 Transcript_115750/m.216679 type:complete len:141 (+) Transcript_115750:52-474(+)